MKGGVSQILIGVVLAAIATFIVVDLAGGLGTFPNERWAAAIAMICLAVWIGPGLLRRDGGPGGGSAALRAIALWLALIVAVALLYVYGKDFLVSIGVNVP